MVVITERIHSAKPVGVPKCANSHAWLIAHEKHLLGGIDQRVEDTISRLTGTIRRIVRGDVLVEAGKNRKPCSPGRSLRSTPGRFRGRELLRALPPALGQHRHPEPAARPISGAAVSPPTQPPSTTTGSGPIAGRPLARGRAGAATKPISPTDRGSRRARTPAARSPPIGRLLTKPRQNYALTQRLSICQTWRTQTPGPAQQLRRRSPRADRVAAAGRSPRRRVELSAPAASTQPASKTSAARPALRTYTTRSSAMQQNCPITNYERTPRQALTSVAEAVAAW